MCTATGILRVRRRSILVAVAAAAEVVARRPAAQLLAQMARWPQAEEVEEVEAVVAAGLPRLAEQLPVTLAQHQRLAQAGVGEAEAVAARQPTRWSRASRKWTSEELIFRW
jgi:hypothetical protein